MAKTKKKTSVSIVRSGTLSTKKDGSYKVGKIAKLAKQVMGQAIGTPVMVTGIVANKTLEITFVNGPKGPQKDAPAQTARVMPFALK